MYKSNFFKKSENKFNFEIKNEVKKNKKRNK